MSTSPRDRAVAMAEAYLGLNATIETLHADVSRSSERLKEEGTQFWRRAIIRAVFAQVEGVIYSLQEDSVFLSITARGVMTKAELKSSACSSQ